MYIRDVTRLSSDWDASYISTSRIDRDVRRVPARDERPDNANEEITTSE